MPFPLPLALAGTWTHNSKPNQDLGLKLRPPAPWVANITKMWRDKCWCIAVLPLPCLFQPQCPWSCKHCVSLEPNPTPWPNGGFWYRLRPQVLSITWMTEIRYMWKRQCLCSLLLSLACLFKPQWPCSGRLRDSLNPYPNSNCGFWLRLRCWILWVDRTRKIQREYVLALPFPDPGSLLGLFSLWFSEPYPYPLTLMAAWGWGRCPRYYEWPRLENVEGAV